MIANETMKSLMSRYSCRGFSAEPVSEEELETVLEAGKYAANGKNRQAWHFTAVRSPEGFRIALTALGEEPPAGFPGTMRWPDDVLQKEAPVLILISGDPAAEFPSCGCHMAAGNMMVAAASLGLGTLWSTAFTKDCFRDEKSRLVRPLLVPDGYEPYAALYLGHPAKAPGPRSSRREKVVSYL